jgi:hypothetical protein
MPDLTTLVSHTCTAFLPDQAAAQACALELTETLPCVVSGVELATGSASADAADTARAARDGRNWMVRAAIVTGHDREEADHPDFVAAWEAGEVAAIEQVVERHGGLVYGVDSTWPEEERDA